MIEKLIFEFPTHTAKCQEKKAALQQQWLGQWFLFQLRGSVWEGAFFGFRCQVSGVNAAAEALSLIEKETLKKRISNIE
jgi:hypothetical protein